MKRARSAIAGFGALGRACALALLEACVRYASDAVYPIGAYVLSGRESLHYDTRGVCVRKREMRPGGPEE